MPTNELLEARSSTMAWFTVAILMAIVLVAAAIRWRLLEVPLERDEGEYAYAGQVILDGGWPYRDVYNMKLPGIYAAYAGVLAIFGQSRQGIHAGLLVINSVTILLVFVLARQLVDDFTGLVAAASFALLSLGGTVQGVFANAEHFVLPPALAGMIMLHWAIVSRRKSHLALSGLLLGSAFVVKQHGAAFVACGGVYLFVKLLEEPVRRWRAVASPCLLFAMAAATPYLLTCLIMALAGVFDNFWFWTFEYARAYAGQVPISEAPSVLLQRVDLMVLNAPLLWLLAVVGTMALAWDGNARRRMSFLVPLAIFSFLSVCPGFYFRPHYFVLTLPAVAIFTAIGARSVATLISPKGSSNLGRILATLLVVGGLADGAARQRRYLFQWTPDEVSLQTYGTSLFKDSLQIANYLRQNSSESDRIAVLGSEPQILFYADRRSATGYVYTYALMERHPYAMEMQREMIREIEERKPKLIAFVNVGHSWGVRSDSHQEIFRWFDEYRRRYQLAVIFELDAKGTRELKGRQLAELQKRPSMSVEIYRRSDENGSD
jgi:hypothetical protein